MEHLELEPFANSLPPWPIFDEVDGDDEDDEYKVESDADADDTETEDVDEQEHLPQEEAARHLLDSADDFLGSLEEKVLSDDECMESDAEDEGEEACNATAPQEQQQLQPAEYRGDQGAEATPSRQRLTRGVPGRRVTQAHPREATRAAAGPSAGNAPGGHVTPQRQRREKKSHRVAALPADRRDAAGVTSAWETSGGSAAAATPVPQPRQHMMDRAPNLNEHVNITHQLEVQIAGAGGVDAASTPLRQAHDQAACRYQQQHQTLFFNLQGRQPQASEQQQVLGVAPCGQGNAGPTVWPPSGSICRRTRAHVSLRDVELADLEQQLPEHVDMEEIELAEDDEEYGKFLQALFDETSPLPDDSSDEDPDFAADLDLDFDDSSNAGGWLRLLHSPGRGHGVGATGGTGPSSDSPARRTRARSRRHNANTGGGALKNAGGSEAAPSGPVGLTAEQLSTLHAQVHCHSQMLVQMYAMLAGDMDTEAKDLASKTKALIEQLGAARDEQSAARRVVGLSAFTPDVLSLPADPPSLLLQQTLLMGPNVDTGFGAFGDGTTCGSAETAAGSNGPPEASTRVAASTFDETGRAWAQTWPQQQPLVPSCAATALATSEAPQEDAGAASCEWEGDMAAGAVAACVPAFKAAAAARSAALGVAIRSFRPAWWPGPEGEVWSVLDVVPLRMFPDVQAVLQALPPMPHSALQQQRDLQAAAKDKRKNRRRRGDEPLSTALDWARPALQCLQGHFAVALVYSPSPPVPPSYWTSAEDDLLMHGISRYGTNWRMIAEMLLISRNATQIANRHKNINARGRAVDQVLMLAGAPSQQPEEGRPEPPARGAGTAGPGRKAKSTATARAKGSAAAPAGTSGMPGQEPVPRGQVAGPPQQQQLFEPQEQQQRPQQQQYQHTQQLSGPGGRMQTGVVAPPQPQPMLPQPVPAVHSVYGTAVAAAAAAAAALAAPMRPELAAMVNAARIVGLPPAVAAAHILQAQQQLRLNQPPRPAVPQMPLPLALQLVAQLQKPGAVAGPAAAAARLLAAQLQEPSTAPAAVAALQRASQQFMLNPAFGNGRVAAAGTGMGLAHIAPAEDGSEPTAVTGAASSANGGGAGTSLLSMAAQLLQASAKPLVEAPSLAHMQAHPQLAGSAPQVIPLAGPLAGIQLPVNASVAAAAAAAAAVAQLQRQQPVLPPQGQLPALASAPAAGPLPAANSEYPWLFAAAANGVEAELPGMPAWQDPEDSRGPWSPPPSPPSPPSAAPLLRCGGVMVTDAPGAETGDGLAGSSAGTEALALGNGGGTAVPPPAPGAAPFAMQHGLVAKTPAGNHPPLTAIASGPTDPRLLFTREPPSHMQRPMQLTSERQQEGVRPREGSPDGPYMQLPHPPLDMPTFSDNFTLGGLSELLGPGMKSGAATPATCLSPQGGLTSILSHGQTMSLLLGSSLGLSALLQGDGSTPTKSAAAGPIKDIGEDSCGKLATDVEELAQPVSRAAAAQAEAGGAAFRDEGPESPSSRLHVHAAAQPPPRAPAALQLFSPTSPAAAPGRRHRLLAGEPPLQRLAALRCAVDVTPSSDPKAKRRSRIGAAVLAEAARRDTAQLHDVQPSPFEGTAQNDHCGGSDTRAAVQRGENGLYRPRAPLFADDGEAKGGGAGCGQCCGDSMRQSTETTGPEEEEEQAMEGLVRARKRLRLDLEEEAADAPAPSRPQERSQVLVQGSRPVAKLATEVVLGLAAAGTESRAGNQCISSAAVADQAMRVPSAGRPTSSATRSSCGATTASATIPAGEANHATSAGQQEHQQLSTGTGSSGGAKRRSAAACASGASTKRVRPGASMKPGRIAPAEGRSYEPAAMTGATAAGAAEASVERVSTQGQPSKVTGQKRSRAGVSKPVEPENAAKVGRAGAHTTAPLAVIAANAGTAAAAPGVELGAAIPATVSQQAAQAPPPDCTTAGDTGGATAREATGSAAERAAGAPPPARPPKAPARRMTRAAAAAADAPTTSAVPRQEQPISAMETDATPPSLFPPAASAFTEASGGGLSLHSLLCGVDTLGGALDIVSLLPSISTRSLAAVCSPPGLPVAAAGTTAVTAAMAMAPANGNGAALPGSATAFAVSHANGCRGGPFAHGPGALAPGGFTSPPHSQLLQITPYAPSAYALGTLDIFPLFSNSTDLWHSMQLGSAYGGTSAAGRGSAARFAAGSTAGGDGAGDGTIAAVAAMGTDAHIDPWTQFMAACSPSSQCNSAQHRTDRTNSAFHPYLFGSGAPRCMAATTAVCSQPALAASGGPVAAGGGAAEGPAAADGAGPLDGPHGVLRYGDMEAVGGAVKDANELVQSVVAPAEGPADSPAGRADVATDCPPAAAGAVTGASKDATAGADAADLNQATHATSGLSPRGQEAVLLNPAKPHHHHHHQDEEAETTGAIGTVDACVPAIALGPPDALLSPPPPFPRHDPAPTPGVQPPSDPTAASETVRIFGRPRSKPLPMASPTMPAAPPLRRPVLVAAAATCRPFQLMNQPGTDECLDLPMAQGVAIADGNSNGCGRYQPEAADEQQPGSAGPPLQTPAHGQVGGVSAHRRGMSPLGSLVMEVSPGFNTPFVAAAPTPAEGPLTVACAQLLQQTPTPSELPLQTPAPFPMHDLHNSVAIAAPLSLTPLPPMSAIAAKTVGRWVGRPGAWDARRQHAAGLLAPSISHWASHDPGQEPTAAGGQPNRREESATCGGAPPGMPWRSRAATADTPGHVTCFSHVAKRAPAANHLTMPSPFVMPSPLAQPTPQGEVVCQCGLPVHLSCQDDGIGGDAVVHGAAAVGSPSHDEPDDPPGDIDEAAGGSPAAASSGDACGEGGGDAPAAPQACATAVVPSWSKEQDQLVVREIFRLGEGPSTWQTIWQQLDGSWSVEEIELRGKQLMARMMALM